MEGEDLIGDLEIWHPLFSMFVKTAKAYGCDVFEKKVKKSKDVDVKAD